MGEAKLRLIKESGGGPQGLHGLYEIKEEGEGEELKEEYGELEEILRQAREGPAIDDVFI